MIKAEYKNLCPICGGNLSTLEIEQGICVHKNSPLNTKFKEELEERLRDLFWKLIGPPRGIQNFWIKRLAQGESFSPIAPTGIGKTTFGLVSAFFFATRGKRSYILVPTTLLVQQAFETLLEFQQKMNVEIEVVFYQGKMKGDQKREFQEKLLLNRFQILITTTQFLSRKFHLLESKVFDFIFVDDVDSILKGSRNVERIIQLLGFKKKGKDWEGEAKGQLIVSTATVKKGRAAQLFRKLLDFDIGSSVFNIRNVEDIYCNAEQIHILKDIVSQMGPGGIIYARDLETATEIQKLLHREFRIGLVSSKNSQDYQLFQKGELELLVGTSYYYGLLIRGLDLPERIRYTVFWGAPVLKLKYQELTAKTLRILALAFRKNPQIQKFLPYLNKLENNPGILNRLQEKLQEVISNEKSEDVVVRGNELLFPDLRTYIQGSGRASRLTARGVFKGASFLLEKDPEILSVFLKKALLFNLSFRKYQELDLEKLRREIEHSRKRGAQGDIIKPALFVVESPTKAKSIARFFGKPSVKILENLIAYEVAEGNYVLLITACLGHIVDLSTTEGFYGVKIEEGNFLPVYQSIKHCLKCNYQYTLDTHRCPRCSSEEVNDSRTRIDSLRKLAYQTEKVIIGTDPDAEGEKIAWDVKNMLSGLAEIKRAEFHEVTPKAIRKALQDLREVNENLVKAQVVRRIEDRWIGFSLSQKLWEVFRNKNISAGRVQTPVLNWVIEAEENFKKKKHIAYIRDLDLELEGVSQEELQFTIVLVEEKTESRSPLPPYSTDELLRDANTILKMSSGETMRLAQELFENGFITYHRTDSTNVSEVGLKIAEEYLREDFKPRLWKSKESAHECIRPTKAWDKFLWQRMIYEEIYNLENIGPQHLALYDLIFRRFMASQCKEFEVKVKIYQLNYGGNSLRIQRVVDARGKALELYTSLRVQNPLPTGERRYKVEFRKQPQGYPLTQAEVIKLMKERSLGRPSTYSAILEKLLLRRYIVEKKHWLFSTPLGKRVLSYLSKNYRKFISEGRTRTLLEKMDSIEQGQSDYRQVVEEIYQEIKEIQK